MRKITLILLFVLALLTLVSTMPAMAQSTTNWCDDGNLWEGKCKSDADWVCGWYLSQYETGEMSYLDLTPECRGYVRMSPAAVGTAAENWCYENGPWEGECKEEFTWTCGWYAAHIVRGEVSLSQVPQACLSMIPINRIGDFCGKDEFGDICIDGDWLVFYIGSKIDGAVDFKLQIYRFGEACPPDTFQWAVNRIQYVYSEQLVFPDLTAAEGYVCFPLF